MKVAIIGAGFAGLSAALEVLRLGGKPIVYERNHFAGGLASGIKQVVDDYPSEWEWDVERFYHHWFTNDDHVKKLVKSLGKKHRLLTMRPVSATWVNGAVHDLDSPISLLKFSPLSIPSRLRLGLAMAYLKYIAKPGNVSKFEDITAVDWLKKNVGEEAYKVVWEPLLKGKFDSEYEKINMTWFWARIYKRTPSLSYYEGGFGALVDDIVSEIENKQGKVKMGFDVQEIVQADGTWVVKPDDEKFDKVIVTTPPPLLPKLFPAAPADFASKSRSAGAIGAFCLLLALPKPFLDDTYWLNINEPDWPFLAVVEHTNFVSSEHYGDEHLLYVGNYLPKEHELMHASGEELLEKFEPFLQKINPAFNASDVHLSWLFKEPFAQPIVGLNHAEEILPIETGLDGVYMATMSQVYPWDRGTNYAIEIGEKVGRRVMEDL